jgi:hypothetical protein
MKYQIQNHSVEAKATKQSDVETIYTVTVDGEEKGKIEKSIYADRIRYSGKMYGYDTKPRAHFRVSEVDDNLIRGYYCHPSLKAAVEYMVNNY